MDLIPTTSAQIILNVIPPTSDLLSMLTEINDKLIQIWVEELSKEKLNDIKIEILNRVPLFHYDFKNKNSILFIGINPAYSEKFPSFLKEDEFKYFSVKDFYNTRDYKNFNFKLDQLTSEKARGYKYFKKFYEIAGEVYGERGKWEHIDLFFFRETSQKKGIELIFENGQNGNYTEFAKKQLKLIGILIEKSEPDIIVVANALASKIFKNHFKENLINNASLDQEHGCYFYLCKEHDKNIPVILTQMFTGQRALDNNTFELLKWQIKSLVNKFGNKLQKEV